MAAQNYSPSEALATLLNMLDGKAPDIADRIRVHIDEGDTSKVLERQEGSDASDSLQYSDEEALACALRVLEAYFLELPMCLHSLNSDFANGRVSLSMSRRGNLVDSTESYSLGSFQFEAETETMRFSSVPQSTVTPQIFSEAQIEEQRKNIDQVRVLFDFEE